MNLGELLFKILGWIYDFWPLRVINRWESGVRIWLGQTQKLLTHENGIFGTGLHWFIPLAGEIQARESNLEVLETSMQTHTVLGQTVTFTLGVRFKISDMKRLYEEIHDPDATIMNELISLAGTAVSSMGEEVEDPEEFDLVEEIRANLIDLLEEAMAESLEAWGIEVKEISLISLAEAPTYRVLADSLLSLEG